MRDPLATTPIRYKLPVTFVVICLAVLLAGGHFVSRFAHSSLETEIARRLTSNADAQARILAGNRELLLRRAQDFASDGLIRELLAAHLDGDAGATVRLRRHLAQNKVPLEPAFADCGVWTPEASLVACAADPVDSAHAREMARLSPADESGFGGFCVSAGGLGPCFVVMTPLSSLDGTRRIGTLSAWVPLSRFLTMTPPPVDTAPRSTRLILRDSLGQELEIPWWFRSKERPVQELMEEGFGLLPRAITAGITTESKDRQVFSRSSDLGPGGWSACIEQDAHEASAPVRELQSRYLGTALAVLGIGIVALFLSIRFIIVPLRRLGDAAGKLARGDLAARVTVESEDEIGELSRAFNDMAHAVEQRAVEVERHRDRLETVVGAMRDGLCLLNHEGSIVLRNGAADPLVGLLDRAAWRPGASCAELLSALGADRNRQVEFGGRHYEIVVNDLPAGGAIGGRLLVSRDVTERRAMSDREAFHERMAVAGELAGIVAHEINNPLASISMFTQMLADDLEPESRFREHIDVISRNVEVCKQTICDLLDNVRGGASSVTELDARDLVEDALRFLRPLAQRCRVRLQTDAGDCDSNLVGDEIRLRQVLVNLVLNAIQAQETTGGEVRVRLRRLGAVIRIDVEDAGPGIPEELRSRVFDPFFTTKKARTGTGLGLPTARRIVEAHGGRLDLCRPLTGGSLFRIELPVAGITVPEQRAEESSW